MSKFSAQDIEAIQEHMNKRVTSRGLPGRVIFEQIGDKISADLTQAQFLAELTGAIRAGLITGFEGRRRVGYVIAGTPRASKTGTFRSSKTELIISDGIKPDSLKIGVTDTEPAVVSEEQRITELADEATAGGFPGTTGALVTRSASKPVIQPKEDESVGWEKHSQSLVMYVDDQKWTVPMTRVDARALLVNVLQATKCEDGPIEFGEDRYTCSDIKLLERFLLCFFESTLTVGKRVAA